MATPEFLNRIKDPQVYIEDQYGHPQTHLMRAEYSPDLKQWIAFPTIVDVGNSTLLRYPEDAWKEAMGNAIRTNNYISFGDDKEAALKYSSGGYKAGTPLEMDEEAFKEKYKRQNGRVE
ncbi:MAG: hypothetical protein ACO24D_17060 [bacterium]